MILLISIEVRHIWEYCMLKPFKIYVLAIFGSIVCDLASYNRYYNGLSSCFSNYFARLMWEHHIEKRIWSGHAKGLKYTFSGTNADILNQYIDYGNNQLDKISLSDPGSLETLSRRIQKSYRYRFWRYRKTMKPTLAKLAQNKIK